MDAAPRRDLAGQPLLVAARISVHYHATAALDEVDLDVRRGEVHAVVGENGAGKSTLLRSIAGAVRLSTGSIRVPRGTRIEWVPQETELPPDLRVSDWLFLARELRRKLGWLRQRAMHDATTAALAALGCTVAPNASIRSLPIVQRKQVQLGRALSGQPDLLLLDEPTAVLGQAETKALFSAVRVQRERGAGILYISHRLDEVLALADRVTVLRDGRRVSTDPIAAVDTATLVRRMVGRDVPPRVRGDAVLGPTALDLVNVAVAHVRGITVAVRRGEVVGFAGLVGAGRSEVLEGIAGLRPLRSGHLESAAAPVLCPRIAPAKAWCARSTCAATSSCPLAVACCIRPVNAARRGSGSRGCTSAPAAAKPRSIRCREEISRSCCWRGRCAASRGCCCWTNRPPAWT